MQKVLGWAGLACLAILSLGGCETAPRAIEPAGPVDQPDSRPDVVTGEAARTDVGRPAPWEDPSSPIHQRVVYFSYDRAEILPEYVPLLRTHGDYLAGHPDVRVRIEGHTDERGTRGYNLALADQRAEAVHRFLIAEGVPERQLDTLSYGEEKPASPGHDESSWSMNRRAELRYQGQ